jgi:hypothetical protein
MPNSLLVSDQFVDSRLSADSVTISASENPQMASNVDLLIFLVNSGRPESWQSPGPSWLPKPAALTDVLRLSGTRGSRRSLAGAKHALQKIQQMGNERQFRRRVEEEADWIARNKVEFSGKWVALLGDRLLASADSAREVFRATKDVLPTPLVIQIDGQDLPFAGW